MICHYQAYIACLATSYSHKGEPSLPSALKSLTSVFGMGTGVTSSPSSPDKLYYNQFRNNFKCFLKKNIFSLYQVFFNNVLYYIKILCKCQWYFSFFPFDPFLFLVGCLYFIQSCVESILVKSEKNVLYLFSFDILTIVLVF